MNKRLAGADIRNREALKKGLIEYIVEKLVANCS